MKLILNGRTVFPQGEEGDKTVAMALANPDQYVLKPQREGGGEWSHVMSCVLTHVYISHLLKGFLCHRQQHLRQ